MSIVIEGRRVVKKGGKFYVYSEDYKKKLGGPYDTKEEALQRLGQIEYFKHKEGKRSLNPEVRSLPLDCAELRVKNGDKGPIIHGYASVFNRDSQDLGGFIERIHPEAFNSALEKGVDVRALVNHDPNHVMGRTKSGTLELHVDDRGLAMQIAPPDTPVMNHFVRSIERGDMDGSSFSFTTHRDDWDYKTDPPTRTVHEVRDLFDVGPVTYPAYLDSSAAKRSFRSSLRRSQPEPVIVPDPRIYRQRLVGLRQVFPSFSIPKG